MDANALAKMANLPKILEAAKVLEGHGLLEQHPMDVIALYIKKNPEIQQAIVKVER